MTEVCRLKDVIAPHVYESCIFLKPLARVMARFLPRAPRICMILQDVAKSFKKNALFLTEKKRTKNVFSTKLSEKSKNYQESCEENLRITKYTFLRNFHRPVSR